MKNYLSLIKFSHTIFAMPFALLGFVLGDQSGGTRWSWLLFLLVVLCMVFARSAAMAFNRYLDRDIDLKNPRTAVREIPTGIISPKSALLFTIISAALFVVTTWFINSTCFALSGVALAVVLGYSYTKRFTPLCHFVLGLGLALAPLGGYLAVTGQFDLLPILYSIAVFLWVSGFDIIYALQDEDFDRELKLKSVPAFLGKVNALRLSKTLHILSAVFVLIASWQALMQFESLGWLSWLAVVLFCGLLFYQHTLVKPNDLRKVNLAFFTTNGVASLIFCSLVILDFYV
ncbi:MAG: putative 4-hydroxybenzoate polyprenyltransferase [Saprospiraceae bacterium]|nr:putative 4-hydroxybenzoate polyprenyltransferase [Saprospiraceae bacterium]MCF8248865.1 putative 4-hydroxybenzoate polyprenyltransferase [Saprospiraceae bacterium]MCF8310150.1 putative 4-hydroxybenzoate polyprenyltransferase [Saprospiraceae bacterium]MCF8439050.1 putative 4-hydroxybenzoate polyprenyltransferase [Saprospiraceae bacterium]